MLTLVKDSKVKTFTFQAYDKTFVAEAERGLDVMEAANRELIWNSKSKDGAWFENGVTGYKWVEGNFFD